MTRYTIHAISSADCNSYEPEILAATDSLRIAKEWATHHSVVVYGTCIHDSETGLVDYGHGFGMDVVLDVLRPDEITEVIPDVDARMRELHERSSE